MHHFPDSRSADNCAPALFNGWATLTGDEVNSIDSRLAQQIVERTMKIIPFNVNVMDVHGIILASGKPARIGEVHAGAQLAMARQRAVEIDAATRQLPGVKPGVNLPLTVRGQICGVVGLTGAPDTVRQFGELVRVTAEMILEQAQLTGELQREKRYREEFVWHLVQAGGTSLEDLGAWAARLGIDFRGARAVLVVELPDETLSPDLALAELHRCQQQLATQHPDLLTAAISPRELVIVTQLDDAGTAMAPSTVARRRLLTLAGSLRQELATPSLLAMGVALCGIDGVALSYQSARQTIRVGRSRRPQATTFLYHDLCLPVLLAGLGSGWQAEQLRHPLQRLERADQRGKVLRRTIETWFAHDGRAQATANALHIHRNTLDYRLRRISEATGLDLANTDDRLLLYIALQLG